MTQEERGPVNAPELTGGEWLQGGPVAVRDHDGPLVIDFWDYTCVNCLRTLPYVQEWHRRYADLGLRVVGVHTPEFSFAKSADHVRRAIEYLDLDYPIVLDGDFKIWQAYANRYWPAKYFVDRTGKIVARHYGEGGYGESEELIQTLLRQQPDFDAELPELMDPVRPEDSAGAVCYRVTPELYCGHQRGLIGNVTQVISETTNVFVDPSKHVEGTLYLEGPWLLQPDAAARPFGIADVSRMHLDYMAADVNLVLHPPLTGNDAELQVLLDGAPVDEAQAGEDVHDGLLTVDIPRMYRLLASDDVDRHSLTLETTSDGVAAYAFTFTSCVAPPPEEG